MVAYSIIYQVKGQRFEKMVNIEKVLVIGYF